jgi:succinate dehydrogenase/fumarate reductase flavoprotein subunit
VAESKKGKKLVTRREFLVGGGAIIAAGALSACTSETITKTVTSTAPGTTVTSKPWLPDKWDEEADLVIVGFGGAGACAAIAAHDKGAEVLIVEKAPEEYAGGNTNVAGGGVNIPDRTGDDIAQRYYDLCWGTSPAEMAADVAEALAGVPEQLRGWGLTFEVSRPGSEASPYSLWNALPGPPGYEECGAGREIWQPLKALVLDKGIEVMYETPVKELIQNPATKEVLGVIAEAQGKKVYLKANKGVVLACGGYEANYEMQGYFHFPGVKLYPWGSPYNTGDGIHMATAAGADLWHMASVEWGSPAIIEPSEEYGVSIAIPDMISPGNFIYVNKYGKRFMDEGKMLIHHKGTLELTHFEDTRAVEEYSNLPFYYVFDDTWKSAGPVGWQQPVATMTGGAPMLWNGIHRTYVWSDDNEAEIAKGWIKKGNTLEELATNLGIDAAGLQETITRYKGFCAAEEDADFARRSRNLVPLETPPYYGMKMGLSLINTQGGPKHNGKSQTLDKDNKPIPRLYSAGECGSYFGFIYPGGSNLAEAFAFGRIAGEHAAALEPWV